jgi:hypothetical protein
VNLVENGSHHGDGEITFEVTVAVHIHHSHGVARANAQSCQGIGQLGNPFVKVCIGVSERVTVYDFLIGGMNNRSRQKVLDQKGV